MGKRALMLAAAMMLCRVSMPLPATAQNTPVPPVAADVSTSYSVNRILGYTAWDDDFLYLAFQVNKPTLKGTNVAPYSNPLGDDALIVSLQRDGSKTATARTDKTYTLAVSAVGGMQLYSGANATPLFESFEDIGKQIEAATKNEPDQNKQAAKRAEILGRILKFQAVQKGFIRPTGTAVSGYTVEVAIPWGDLGGRPDADARMGFSVVAQSTTPDSPLIQSFAPKVKTPEDAANPSLWGEIVFRNAPGTDANAATVAPRVLGAKPTIDGELGETEWNRLAGFEFGERAPVSRNGGSQTETFAARTKPDFTPKPARPAVPPRQMPLPELTAHSAQKFAPMVLGLYRMDYQADTRRSTPATGVFAADGSTLLSVHPLNGMGPWFSSERANWHRRELSEMRRSGIDAALVVYRPARNSRLPQNALQALASALEALRASGRQDYPQIGLCLDMDALFASEKSNPNGTADVLFRALREFYRTVPSASTFAVPLSAANGGRMANVVFLSGATLLTDAETLTLRRQFAQEFGRDLLLVGRMSSKDTAKLDGYFGETRAAGFQFSDAGIVKIASVGAGYDVPSLPDTVKAFRSRKNGETYREDWKQALAKRPDWVLIDGWNDYANGAAVAPTMEYGYSSANLTTVYARLFAGGEKLGAKVLAHDAPMQMIGGASYQVTALAQNTGVGGWGDTAFELTPVGFGYRWLKNGQVVATGRPTTLDSTILAGQNTRALLAVRTQDETGKPLAAGTYTLEIGAVTVNKGGSITGWIGNAAGTATVQMPVTIGNVPTWGATLIASDLPRGLESGSVPEVRVTVRNDGNAAWHAADGVRIGVRLYAAVTSSGVSSSAETPVESADASAVIPNDVLPGELVTVRVPVPLLMPDGKPLPTSEGISYTARYEVFATKGTRTAGLQDNAGDGVAFAPTPVSVVDFDFGVQFLANGTPNTLPVARRLPVRLSLKNVGAQTWKKEGVRIGYHWYYQDGTEVIWEDETTPLPKDVAPGETLKEMLAWVSAPPYDGNYTLVWDVKFGNTWASTVDGSRVFDETARQMDVTGGRLAWADLTKLYNLDGISEDSNPADGDFDGKGNTFPSPLLPPYANATVAPATMWLPTAKTGPDSPRRISFRMGSKEEKTPNFIACQGQKIDISKSAATCRVLHILAATTGNDTFASLKLFFQEPTGVAEDITSLKVERWDKLPANMDNLGFAIPQRHTRKGIVEEPVYLHHYTIKMREGRKLIALGLPVLPDVKIAAITMEK